MAYRRAFDEVFYRGTIQTVAKLGIEKTRTKHIAEYAGFSEATMFKMFPSKEILLRDTFLYLDKKISNMITQNSYIRNPEKKPFVSGIYDVWFKIYRYLLENKEEALFLIRYRYSSLYTEEVIKMRELSDGSYNKVFELLDDQMGKTETEFKNFLIGYAFDVTLCFIEKIISGKLEDDQKNESYIWLMVTNTAKSWFGLQEAAAIQK